MRVLLKNHFVRPFLRIPSHTAPHSGQRIGASASSNVYGYLQCGQSGESRQRAEIERLKTNKKPAIKTVCQKVKVWKK